MSVWTENIIAEFHQKILSGCLKIWKIRQGITFFAAPCRWWRFYGAAKAENGGENSSTCTTEGSNSSHWRDPNANRSRWSTLCDTERVHGHGTVWFGSRQRSNDPDGMCWTVGWLSSGDLWLVDSTFKVVPTVFFQLYSIHFDFGSGIHLAAV